MTKTTKKGTEVVGSNTTQASDHSSTPYFNEKSKVRWYPSFTFYPEVDTSGNPLAEPKFDPATMKYLGYGAEICPHTQRFHWQGCVYFYQPNRFKMAQKLMNIGNSHIENIPKSDNKNGARIYIKKDGNYKEFGEFPEQGARTDLVEIKNELVNGTHLDDIILERPMMYHQYGRTLEKVKSILLNKVWRTWMTDGVWIWGETGTGKSEYAFKDYDPRTVYAKNLNEEFWDGYEGQPTVILNEFRGQIKWCELLDLVDKHPKTVKIKGKQSVQFLAKKFIITSCLHPRDCYVNSYGQKDKYVQFQRRFTIIEKTKFGEVIEENLFKV